MSLNAMYGLFLRYIEYHKVVTPRPNANPPLNGTIMLVVIFVVSSFCCLKSSLSLNYTSLALHPSLYIPFPAMLCQFSIAITYTAFLYYRNGNQYAHRSCHDHEAEVEFAEEAVAAFSACALPPGVHESGLDAHGGCLRSVRLVSVHPPANIVSVCMKDQWW